jgi:magnesium chelatase family protein
MGIGYLNSRVVAGVGAAGKAVSQVDLWQIIRPRETRKNYFQKNYFQKKRLILISDGFPGMETFRVLTATGDKSETIRERVVQARKIQDERFRKSGNATNSAMNPRQMKLHCQIDAEGTGVLEHAMEEMNFTARTQADLVGAESIRLNDVLEAIQYCSLDRKLVS